MVGGHQILRPELRPYLCHSGTQAGHTCTFVLAAPPRSRSIPYSHLLVIDALGDRLVTLRYSFVEVEISLGRDFCGKHLFLDDLAGFRVALVREGPDLRLRLVAEPFGDKSVEF